MFGIVFDLIDKYPSQHPHICFGNGIKHVQHLKLVSRLWLSLPTRQYKAQNSREYGVMIPISP